MTTEGIEVPSGPSPAKAAVRSDARRVGVLIMVIGSLVFVRGSQERLDEDTDADGILHSPRRLVRPLPRGRNSVTTFPRNSPPLLATAKICVQIRHLE